MSVLNLDDVKSHLNIETDDDDTLLQEKINAAEAWIGEFIGNAIDDATAFPGGTPEPVKEGVRQLVGHLYENREATIVGISMNDVTPGVFDLIRPYRSFVF